MLTLRGSVCHCALASRSLTPTYMAGMLSCKMITSHWKWFSRRLSMQLSPVFNACLSACKNLTLPFSTNLVEMVLANYLSHFLSHKEYLPIPIAKHSACSINAKLDVIQGSVSYNPVYSTVYHLTLRGWLEHRQQVPSITRHFRRAWDESTFSQNYSTAPLLTCMVQIRG